MSPKGLVILLVCLGVGTAFGRSNYMKPNNAGDNIKQKGEYKKPPVSQEVVTTEESMSTQEVNSQPSYGKPIHAEDKEEEQKTTVSSYTKGETQTEESQTEETQTEETQTEETQKEVTQNNKAVTEASTEENLKVEESQTTESKVKESITEKPFIGKKCSFNKSQVEKTYDQWCDNFGKKNYPKLLKMYAKDGNIMVLSDKYHVHNPEELKKLLAALNILETTFNVKKCEDFIASHVSTGCDPKTKTASLIGKMKTSKFDPPITGSFKEILIEEDGQLKIYSQELDINDDKK